MDESTFLNRNIWPQTNCHSVEPMGLRETVEDFIENGGTIEWAAGFAVKHTVESLISVLVAAVLAVPVAILIPFLSVPGIDIAIFGITASLQDLTRLSGFVAIWIVLAGIFFSGTRCNYA